MKNVITYLIATGVDILITAIGTAARKIKKKLRGKEKQCVEANKN